MPTPWFPGHMAKARRVVSENLKLVDLVVEVLDARAPFSSRNPEINQIIGNKPRVIALNKADLADEKVTLAWADCLRSFGWPTGPVNGETGEGIEAMLREIRLLTGNKTNPIRVEGTVNLVRRQKTKASIMLVGIPNVGKSSILNRLGDRGRYFRGYTPIPENFSGGPRFGRKADNWYKKLARIGALPGVTRGQQWVQVGKQLRMLDIPGILWPKLEDQLITDHLSFIGAISDTVLDLEEVAGKLIQTVHRLNPKGVEGRYRLRRLKEHPTENIDHVAEVKNCLLDSGRPDRLRTAAAMLSDFREGKLGRISLETPIEYGDRFRP